MTPSVLFVCRHNTGRSQMAEAYLRHFLGDRIRVAELRGAQGASPASRAMIAHSAAVTSETESRPWRSSAMPFNCGTALIAADSSTMANPV